SPVCPGCGVAVVPGYVRCPRCHAALPIAAPRRNASTIDPGGTSVARSEMPRPVLYGLGAIAVIVVGWLVIGWVQGASRDDADKPGLDGGAGDQPLAEPTPSRPNAPV